MKIRRFLVSLLCVFVLITNTSFSHAQQIELNLKSESSVLMEASTGKIIYEENAKEHLSPASITKIMTLLLIFEALNEGRISLTDSVVTSEYASSMGGSQVFLEVNEIQTVETMIKCIVVASANDASVAMGEFIAGTNEQFVARMNERAKELGMNDTHFVDCCGLTDSSEHYTCAYDIALMSRELILNHPTIFEYTQIWMEDITHTTAKGNSVFTLSSTNKLLKQYQWTTGLKTGFTSKAKFCLSATANKNDIQMIAVVMKAPDSKTRFSEAAKLLEYGYSVSRIYEDTHQEELEDVHISGGIKNKIKVAFEGPFTYLDISGNDLSGITQSIQWNDKIKAPIKEGDMVGKAVYELNGSVIGECPIISKETVDKAGYGDYLFDLIKKLLI